MTEDPDAPWKPGYTGPEPVASRPGDAGVAPPHTPLSGDVPSVRGPSVAREELEVGYSGRPDDPFSPNFVGRPPAADDVSTPGVLDIDRTGDSPVDDGPRWDDVPVDDEPGRRGPRTTWAIAGVVAAAAVVLAATVAVVAIRRTDEAGSLASVASGSIPDSAGQRWEWSGGGGMPATSLAVVGDTVGAVIESRGGVERHVVGLDVGTGEVRWERRDVEIDGGFEFVPGTVAALVLRGRFDQSRTVALDPMTGQTLWVRSAPQTFVLADPGSDHLVETSFEESPEIALVDPRTGEEVGRHDGSLATTNFDGSWVLLDDSAGELSIVDLGAESIEFTPVGRVGDDPGMFASGVALIGTRVLVTESGAVVEVGPGPDGATTPITVVDHRSDPVDDDLVVDGSFRGGNTFGGVGVGGDRGVLIGPDRGVVVGVRLDADELIVDWSREMVFFDVHVTDDGVLIQGADDFGFADGRFGDDAGDGPADEINRSYLVDAVTGDIVVEWDQSLAFDAVGAASNGFTVLEPNVERFRRDLVGYDSAGDTMWRVEGDVLNAAIGDDVVVVSGRFSDTTVIRGYGP